MPGPHETKLFYTVKEIASLLRVSLNTAYRYMHTPPKRGSVPMPVQRFGGALRIPKEKFDKWAGLI